MILALSNRNRILEDKVEELIKRQLSERNYVVQWLNDNYQETCSFNDYITEFEIDDSHFQLVTKYDYVDVFTVFLKNVSVDEESKLPIMAFDQKDNTLFIKKEDGCINFQLKNIDVIGSIAK